MHASSPSDVVDAFVHAQEDGSGAIAVELGFDPAGSDDAARSTIPAVRDPSIAPALPAPELPTSGGPFTFDLILAGSEVIRAGAVEALRQLADETGLGVFNVFTAKGLFRWDSPYHLGTAGLQLHDFALAGLASEPTGARGRRRARTSAPMPSCATPASPPTARGPSRVSRPSVWVRSPASCTRLTLGRRCWASSTTACRAWRNRSIAWRTCR